MNREIKYRKYVIRVLDNLHISNGRRYSAYVDYHHVGESNDLDFIISKSKRYIDYEKKCILEQKRRKETFNKV